VLDILSVSAPNHIEIIPEEDYETVGRDGPGLRVPENLDESICSYLTLSDTDKIRFDRALYWLDLSSRQWHLSTSASYAALVSAIEALTDRGVVHRFPCPKCGEPAQHEVPGSTQLFRDFIEEHAPGVAHASERSAMYRLRSKILHGSDLMQFDEDYRFGWDAPGWQEYMLMRNLSGLTRRALRHWLQHRPSGIATSAPISSHTTQ
jgi:hypothetical protein